MKLTMSEGMNVYLFFISRCTFKCEITQHTYSVLDMRFVMYFLTLHFLDSLIM